MCFFSFFPLLLWQLAAKTFGPKGEGEWKKTRTVCSCLEMEEGRGRGKEKCAVLPPLVLRRRLGWMVGLGSGHLLGRGETGA